jgi:2-octaprenyl-6-methoxyphenol hydroxylase
VAALAGAGGDAMPQAPIRQRRRCWRSLPARRRPDALLMIGATHALEKLFGNDIGPVRLARRLGIAAVDRIGPLKRLFARQAMGLPLRG